MALWIVMIKNERRKDMEITNSNVVSESSWQDVNRAECDEASLFDMCSWGEAN